MSPAVVVPAALRAAMTAAHGPAGTAWCDRLPELVARYATRWAVVPGEPYPATWHWVAPAGETVLKIGYPTVERDVAREAAVLSVWDGRGAVRLLAADVGGDDAEAVLLEWARPGTDLLAAPDEEAFSLMGAVARALHTAGHARPGLAVDAGALVDLHTGHPDLPPRVTGAAADVLDGLLATTGVRALCHGDLHHANVLRAGKEWLAIDPHGVWGEPALDAGTALLNPPRPWASIPDLIAIVDRRVALLAEGLAVPAERVRAWGRVSAVVGAVWTAQDHGRADDDVLTLAEGLA